MNIENVVAFAISKDRNVTNRVIVSVFNYKLPNKEWNSWNTVIIDKKSRRRYIEIDAVE